MNNLFKKYLKYAAAIILCLGTSLKANLDEAAIKTIHDQLCTEEKQKSIVFAPQPLSTLLVLGTDYHVDFDKERSDATLPGYGFVQALKFKPHAIETYWNDQQFADILKLPIGRGYSIFVTEAEDINSIPKDKSELENKIKNIAQNLKPFGQKVRLIDIVLPQISTEGLTIINAEDKPRLSFFSFGESKPSLAMEKPFYLWIEKDGEICLYAFLAHDSWIRKS